MEQKYTYLIINILTITLPFSLSFDKKVAFYKFWPRLFPALFVSAAIFTAWDMWFTQKGVWHFNPDYLTGIFIGNLPMEECLFFFTVPYACIFILACLEAYFPKIALLYSPWPARLFIPLSIGLALLFHEKIYTALCFAALAICWLLYALLLKSKKNILFLTGWLIHLLPFALVNGFLTALPVVIYNPDEKTGLMLGSIPAEDAFYSMALLLNVFIIYEWLGKKNSTKH